MTELAWTATRADTIDRFNGQTPRPEDENVIIDVFEAHPQLVLRAIDETADALKAGKITWAWSVLRSRLERGTNALREATADTSTERTKRIRNAKRWIDNAGLYFDRQDQLEAELFGDDYQRGMLNDYAADDQVRADIVAYWLEQRPRGEQAAAAAETWMRQCAAGTQLVRDLHRKHLDELAAKAEAHHQPPDPGDEDIDFDTNTRLTPSDHAATLTTGSTS